MPWKNKIGSTLGAADAVFASHETERRAAAELLADCVKLQIDYSDLEQEFKKVLLQRNPNSAAHRRSQTSKMRKMFRPWLDRA